MTLVILIVEVRGNTDAIRSAVATGELVAEWVLGARFVRGTGFVKTADGSNDFEIIQLRGWDEQAGHYRAWSFMSNGMSAESEATWDEATKTMSEVTRYGEITQTTERNFAEDAVETWHQVNTDASGAVVSEMRGVNTRRD